RWNLPSDSALVGSVGALNPLKGHEDFLKAAAEVGRAFPTAYFIIAGVDISPEQTNRARLERMIGELKLDTRVRFIGRMDDITPLYCALDLFVSASRTESFGLAIAEAMAGETAVVATATEGAREIIQEGKTGLLVKVGDVNALAESVAALLRDKETREQMGKSARDDVRVRFSLDRMVDATERIYHESLSPDRS
ncbi:MAG: glycosyltransferase family 4 protein, partial [Pyrinomonadaceae bacterium]